MILAYIVLVTLLGSSFAQNALNKGEVHPFFKHLLNKQLINRNSRWLVDRTDFPYQAYLQEVIGQEHICSASLIDNRHLISSAYCMYTIKEDIDIGAVNITNVFDLIELRRPESLQVGLGGTLVGNESLVRVLKYIFTHEGFNFLTGINDISVIRIADPIQEFSVAINSINFTQTRPVTGAQCVISAWIPWIGGELPELTSLPITVKNPVQCIGVWGIVINATTFCAGPIDGATSSCIGEHGSPLICNNVLSGIVVHHSGCSGQTVVATDISRYSNWITIQQNKSSGSMLINSIYLIGLCVNTSLFMYNVIF